jgi:hypothetical protein
MAGAPGPEDFRYCPGMEMAPVAAARTGRVGHLGIVVGSRSGGRRKDGVRDLLGAYHSLGSIVPEMSDVETRTTVLAFTTASLGAVPAPRFRSPSQHRR